MRNKSNEGKIKFTTETVANSNDVLKIQFQAHNLRSSKVKTISSFKSCFTGQRLVGTPDPYILISRQSEENNNVWIHTWKSERKTDISTPWW